MIGKWNIHNSIYVLIPGLYNQDRLSAFLTTDEKQIFYEKGFWPAARELMEAEADDWPPDYRSERFRETNSRGRPVSQTKIIPEHYVPLLADAIRQELRRNRVPWGDGIYILHQIQGVKNANLHRPEPQSAQLALDAFLQKNALVHQRLHTGRWFIDVGLEIYSQEGQCLAWRTDSHTEIVGDILQINETHANRITTLGSSQYARDMTSHMPALSGCRIKPGESAKGPYSAHYLQLYLTDKSVTA